MRSVLPFDELNTFKERVIQLFANSKQLRRRLSKKEEEDILDEMLDLFLLAYTTGVDITNASLSSDWEPTLDEVMETVDEKVAGKDWRERTEEIFSKDGSAEEIIRIAETETHRIANTAALKSAKIGGAGSKTWMTMLDDKVRDTHYPLEGQTVPIDGNFYTWDGDQAPAPGLFAKPENNINCRCELKFN